MKLAFGSIVAAALVVPALSTAANAQPVWTSADYHPNPSFHPIRVLDLSSNGGIEQVGEVVILEGDDTLVASDGMGNFGIDNAAQGQPAITGRFYTRYSDQFDELIVFTTFDDAGAMGASAYEISVQQDVGGIGRPKFDQSALWGATNHTLAAFVNMMRWDQFSYFGLPVTDPGSYLYAVLGQEFAHRWLSYLHYVDKSGAVSAALLGRDASHWASTLQADASVMDGNLLVDNGDGSFTVKESFQRYSPLDLYAMGLEPASQVPPFFRVQGAQHADGTAVDPTRYLERGSRFTGTREDILVDQVLAAEGPRIPLTDTASHAFRVAFVLVTRPGERAGQVIEIAKTLDQVRRIWERKFGEFTGARGTMCTQVSAPCGAAEAQIAGGSVTESGGNGNGVVEPGEPVKVTLQLANPSPADATPVAVSAFGTIVGGRADANLGLLGAGATGQIAFAGSVAADAQCGVPLVVDAQTVVGQNTFRGFVQVVPGLTSFLSDRFDRGSGHFAADLARTDRGANGWQWGTPTEYHGNYGFIFQPGGGVNGQDGCWFTGLQAASKPSYRDSGLGVGQTSLWSEPLDASKLYQPELDYFAWFEAIDFSNPKNVQVPSDALLRVEASGDAGATWHQIDSVGGVDPHWREHHVVLAASGLDLTRSLVLRFTVVNPSASYLVEAGLDDLSLTTLTPACNPNAPAASPVATSHAGGCQAGGRSSAPLGMVVVLLVALALLARGRARA